MAAVVARAPDRDAHTIGQWTKAFAEGGPRTLAFGQSGGSPALNGDQQAELKAAVQELPSQAGIDLSNWKAVRRYVSEDDDLLLQRRPFRRRR